jgi:hypothetical protein
MVRMIVQFLYQDDHVWYKPTFSMFVPHDLNLQMHLTPDRLDSVVTSPLLHPLPTTLAHGTEKVFHIFEKKSETGLKTRSGDNCPHRGDRDRRPGADPVDAPVEY